MPCLRNLHSPSVISYANTYIPVNILDTQISLISPCPARSSTNKAASHHRRWPRGTQDKRVLFLCQVSPKEMPCNATLTSSQTRYNFFQGSLFKYSSHRLCKRRTFPGWRLARRSAECWRSRQCQEELLESRRIINIADWWFCTRKGKP